MRRPRRWPRRLRAEAAPLHERFNRDFWIDERGGYYAVGLDGDKRPIDSMTSNMGHLLWSGIVPTDRADAVVRQLMSRRTCSPAGASAPCPRDDAAYNPIGYHLGTVWPHDNSLIALGLARYGYREEANRIALAHDRGRRAVPGHRLPEAFCGLRPVGVGRFPVPYPTACSPQAWATGTPLALVRAMLGVEPGRRPAGPRPRHPARDRAGSPPSGSGRSGNCWEVEAVGRSGHVRLAEC